MKTTGGCLAKLLAVLLLQPVYSLDLFSQICADRERRHFVRLADVTVKEVIKRGILGIWLV